MKILQVITSLYTGGAEKLMVDLLPRMKCAGHNVELCVFCGDKTPFYEQLEQENIIIHSFHNGIKQLYNPVNILRLYQLIHVEKYDVVHTHNTAPQLFAAICALLTKTVLVTTEHNTTNRRRQKVYLKPFDNWMYSQYHKIICISDQAEINFRDYCKQASDDNTCVIYNGINVQRYLSAPPASDVKEIGYKIITNVAAFRPQKDQPTLIRAMQYLPADFHLCLVGGGDEQRKIELEQIISKLGLADRVHFLGLRNDVPEILAASDYVVMCSHYEGLSLSSLEGMSSGKPFLADNVDGLREIVSGYGVLFEHEDAKGFAKAILALDRDEKYKKQIIKQCQARAQEYDIEAMVDKYLTMYKEIKSI